MKKLVVSLFLFFSFINVYANENEVVEFVKCVDGDTAVFKVNDEEKKFRFLAIDTPETVHPTKAVEKYGKDASEYTCHILTNAKEIVVEYEKSKTDKYGRTLAWIWADGSLLQEELIKVGYANVAYIYAKYKYTDSLCLVQSKAKEEKVGMWNDKKEEGYCSTVNLDGVTNIIDYSKIDVDTTKKDSKKESKATEETFEEKFDKFASNHEKEVNIIYYIVIGVAITYIVFKNIKRK